MNTPVESTPAGVKAWDVFESLGKGFYGEVFRAERKPGRKNVALKKSVLRDKNAECTAETEMDILSRLRHKNIVKMFSCGIEEYEGERVCTLELEYLPGGELFRQLKPYKGLSNRRAKEFFNQLIDGVEYLHTFGVAHRDLKPENLLLRKNKLKIADFGCAMVFRDKGIEKMASGRTGTQPYKAPEIYTDKAYCAKAVDVWACAIILVIMLVGYFPWKSAELSNKEYVAWVENQYQELMPWTEIDSVALSLLQRMLAPVFHTRAGIAEIKEHPWMEKNKKGNGGPQTNTENQTNFENQTSIDDDENPTKRAKLDVHPQE